MQFKALADNLGLAEDEFLELVELFIETSNADFSAIIAAADGNNAREISEKAHSIKGASGNLGFLEVYESAKIIEETSRNEALDKIREQIGDLKAKLETIEAQYRS